MRAREVVLATGAIEQPLVFPGNDRPGIMLAGAAQAYLNRYGVRAGSRAVLVTATDSAYQAALDLRAAGVQIVAIADLRESADGVLPRAARRAGIETLFNASVLGTRGNRRVSGIELATVDERGRAERRTLSCDLILMSGGFTPSVHLFSQSRGKLAWSEAARVFVPAASAERERSAGACRGLGDLATVLRDGAEAGAEAARACGHRAVIRPFTVTGDAVRADTYPAAPAQQTSGGGSKAFVDWQNDVTTKDLALATREGFRSIEHVKRYTTVGMATDQGKTSNLNALGIVAKDLGKTIPEVGLTTFRMPYTPITFGSFAGMARGDLFDPVRTTPMHEWAKSQGAVFEDVGLWKRARYFPRAGEDMHAAVARECRAVRSTCGIFDASTLGKIAVVGPDAAEFLNRLYINSWSNLAVGRARYGILLRDDGFIYDDGVVARTAPERFHVTTTTGGAARVLAMMEDYRQTEWSDLQVWLTSTTEQWAVIAVQGPAARRVLQPLVEGVDISAGALPHMGVATGTICGTPMLLFRVSFSGELGYEINVPPESGRGVWEAVHAVGLAHGITPYGTETMHVLRAEKGYRHRRPGHGRHGDTRGRRPRLGHRSRQAGFRRQAFARTRGDEGSAAQAARRLAHARCRHGSRGGGAGRRNRRAEAADEIVRPCDVFLLQRSARAFDRARDGGCWPRAHWADTLRADARRRHRSRSDLTGVLRQGRGAPAWLNPPPGPRRRTAPAGCERCRRPRASSCKADRTRARRRALHSACRCR